MRRIVVTGANKGIGRALVEAILEQHPDTFVFLGAREGERGRAARDALVRERPGWAERIEVVELDVTSDAGVQAAARHVVASTGAERDALYAVVNNAGIGLETETRAAVMDVNAVGIRRVTDAFIPLLQRDGGRVVNITSAAGPSFVARCSPARQRAFVDASTTRAQFQALLDECHRLADAEAFEHAGLADGQPYGLSKACANLWTLIIAREHPNLRINACTPGYIETDLTRGYAASVGKKPAELGMKPPAEGTRAPMHLLFGALEGAPGEARYYGSDAVRSPLDRYRAPGSPAYAP